MDSKAVQQEKALALIDKLIQEQPDLIKRLIEKHSTPREPIIIIESVGQAAHDYSYKQYGNSCGAKVERKICQEDFIAGAKWQEEQFNNKFL